MDGSIGGPSSNAMPGPEGHEEVGAMRQIGVGIIGTGWCGGIRA